jgi:plastocyanin
VEIDGFEYNPESITINRTDSVTFVNVGNYPESATCFLDGKEVFDTDVLGPGASITLAFNELLSCEYYSVTYSFVKGQITVQPNPTD